MSDEDRIEGLTAEIESLRARIESLAAAPKMAFGEGDFLVEAAPIGIGIHVDGKIVYGNPAVAEIFGYGELTDVLGATVIEFVAPEARDEARERTRQLTDGPAPSVEWNTTGVRQDGTRFPLNVRSVPMDTAAGKGTLAFLMDMTELTAAREKLEASEARFRALFDHSPVAMWEEDWTGVKAAIDGTGLAGEELVAHLRGAPEEALAIWARAETGHANQAALDLTRAADQWNFPERVQELLREFPPGPSIETLAVMSLGGIEFHSDTVDVRIDGEATAIRVCWSAAPEQAHAYSHVVMCLREVGRD